MPPINKNHPYVNFERNFDGIPLCNAISDQNLKHKLKEMLKFYSKGLPNDEDIYSPQWIPNYVNHGVIHHRNVWVIANRLINNNPEIIKPLNDYEKFCFGCSIWLHDIGMSQRLAPIFKKDQNSKIESESIKLFLKGFIDDPAIADDKPPFSEGVVKDIISKKPDAIRDYHSLISDYYIRNPDPIKIRVGDRKRARPDSTLDEKLRNLTGMICRFHQSTWKLESCENQTYENEEGVNYPINTRYLSALLRLVDGIDQLMLRCVGDSSVIIDNNLSKINPDPKFLKSRDHHLEKIIEDVSLEQGKIKIKIESTCPLNDEQKAALKKYKNEIVKTLNECIPHLIDGWGKSTLNVCIPQNNLTDDRDALFEVVNNYFPDPLSENFNSEDNQGPVEKPAFGKRFDLRTKYLSMILDYPNTNPSQIRDPPQASWAVKEILVLQGEIEEAIKKPGLGVAIHSVEFALDVFGSEESLPGIDKCIEWGIKHRHSEFPHLLKGKVIDEVTRKITETQDLRHTLAFAVILALTKRNFSDLKIYLDQALKNQNTNGGWPPNPKDKTPEIITVVYATKLLDLCSRNTRFRDSTRDDFIVRRNNAIQWLIKKQNKSTNLWSGGTFKDYKWDDLQDTAFVLAYLSPHNDILVPGWEKCILTALKCLTEKAPLEDSWKDTSKIQRFRVEARIAYAISIVLQKRTIPPDIKENAERYLRLWKDRLYKFAKDPEHNDPNDKKNYCEWDLATALCTLDGLYTRDDLHEYWSRYSNDIKKNTLNH